MRKIYTLIIACIFLHGISAAQTITGTVYDANRNRIADAYIYTASAAQHAHTNDNGIFVLDDIHIGDSLFIHHIGYETVLYRVQDFSDAEIMLTEQLVELDAVIIAPQMPSSAIIAKMDLLTTPINSAQDILREVPGLMTGQHAGGGKAEQMFLRGFDVDHGTDVAISVDGIPVNMVSHAHGQGYADLHFVIPETIQHFDYGKGPYYADQGNFSTAAFVNFQTTTRLDNNMIKLESGSFNTYRFVTLLKILDVPNHQLNLAVENMTTDGYFNASQHFFRRSLLLKYAGTLRNKDNLIFSVSAFSSSWDASGQIPMRVVDSIGRFGAIDSSEGGSTARSNISLQYQKYIRKNAAWNTTVYYSAYRFQLFSNFTFYLEDPINGDQIKQNEKRNLFGGASKYILEKQLASTQLVFELAVGIRCDFVNDIELAHTLNRYTTLDIIQLGDIFETNAFAYTNVELAFGDFLINAGIRYDHFIFQYTDDTDPLQSSETQNADLISPKLNIFFTPSGRLQLFIKSGIGFHSNDTRVRIDQSITNALPKAYGADVGLTWKPAQKCVLNFAIWSLYLQQEFVYVGDAGILELSGPTWRNGADLGVRYQLAKGWHVYSDITYSYARAVNTESNAAYIPLAPVLTATGGITYSVETGLYGGMRFRMMGDRPANETYTTVAEGYCVTDINLGYVWKDFDFGIRIENVFNTEWNETQFDTESRLQYETTPVQEIHFTPGTPISIRAMLAYTF